MTWYAAHIVMLFEFKDGRQDCYPAWENIVLICGATAEEAHSVAQRCGKRYESESVTWNERSARLVFAGVRKLTECVDSETRPTSESEITYTELEFVDGQSFGDFVSGRDANAVFLEVLYPD